MRRHSGQNSRSKAAATFATLVITCAAITAGTVSASSAASGANDTSKALKTAKWGSSIKTTFKNGSVVIATTDIPNHARDAYYAVPHGQIVVPDASTAEIVKDPTKPQNLSFIIPTKPQYSSTITNTPLGSIGVMISGSVLFNPYEGDGKTVAMSSNFSLTNADGSKVWFVDHCSGHPTPDSGIYHYHAGSTCVIRQVDTQSGPSHMIGVALDGFPIYGPRDIKGKTVPTKSLDRCNGIKSATPEFPKGIYHYVLPRTSDATSSIRCFHGVVDSKQIMQMPPMGAMPDLDAAAAKLGITKEKLIAAFGNAMPPDFAKAAAALGISEAELRAALGAPVP